MACACIEGASWERRVATCWFCSICSCRIVSVALGGSRGVPLGIPKDGTGGGCCALSNRLTIPRTCASAHNGELRTEESGRAHVQALVAPGHGTGTACGGAVMLTWAGVGFCLADGVVCVGTSRRTSNARPPCSIVEREIPPTDMVPPPCLLLLPLTEASVQKCPNIDFLVRTGSSRYFLINYFVPPIDFFGHTSGQLTTIQI